MFNCVIIYILTEKSKLSTIKSKKEGMGMNFKKILSMTLITMIIGITSTPVIAATNVNSEQELTNFIKKNNITTLSITDSDRAIGEKLDSLSTNYKTANFELKNSDTLHNEEFTLLEIAEDSDEKVVSYQIHDTRYIIHYFNDGKISKSVIKYNPDGSFEFQNNFNNEREQKTLSVDLVEITNVINEDEYMERVKNRDKDSTFKNITPMSRAKKVDPYPISSRSEYYADYKQRTTYSFPALDNLGYPKSQPVKLYETSGYFSTKTEKTTLIDAKGHIDLAAAWWDIATSTAKGFYNIAGVAMDTYGYLKEASEPVRDHEYYFQGGIEATVYDPTRHNGPVEVLNEWGSGVWTLIFQRGYNKFTNAQWGISAPPSPWDTSYDTHISEAANIYNSNINMYGVWKHGVGRLGY